MNNHLIKGRLLYVLLLDLINKEMPSGLYGYAIILSVKKKFGVYLGPSTLYPELKSLESKALINSVWNTFGSKPRRIYKITEKGKRLLLEYSMQLRIMAANLMQTAQQETCLKELILNFD